MFKIAIFLTFLAVTWAVPRPEEDLDAILAELLGTPPQITTQSSRKKPSTIVPTIVDKGQETIQKCKTDEGKSGQCVAYYQCNAKNGIITDGEGMIDIRVSGECKSYMDVCCEVPDVRDDEDPITPGPDKVPERDSCGWRNPNGVGFRITGDKDNEAKFAEFPWMVAVLRVELLDDSDPEGQKLNVYAGGGSLIHPSAVLTAAHTVEVGKTYNVRAGEWDTKTSQEIYPHQDRAVASIRKHENFNSKNLFNDVALLFLTSPVELAPNVGVVCLPPPGRMTPSGTQCLASGWGKDQFGDLGAYQVIMKRVELAVVERKKCQTQLRATRLGPYFKLNNSFMCAGGLEGQDTCKGDGGSPLVCPAGNEIDRYVQSGIVSWGIGCGDIDVPGVYVDVSSFRGWIDRAITAKGLDPSVYTI